MSLPPSCPAPVALQTLSAAVWDRQLQALRIDRHLQTSWVVDATKSLDEVKRIAVVQRSQRFERLESQGLATARVIDQLRTRFTDPEGAAADDDDTRTEASGPASTHGTKSSERLVPGGAGGATGARGVPAFSQSSQPKAGRGLGPPPPFTERRPTATSPIRSPRRGMNVVNNLDSVPTGKAIDTKIANYY